MSSVDDCSPASKRVKFGDASQLFDKKRGSAVREIAFSAAFPSRELKLLEIPSDLLKMVENGENLRIVGARSAEAVLCSNSKTYALKRVETSNCVLCVPPSTGPRFTIESVSADYYELRQIPGRLEQLRTMLFPACVYPSKDKASSGALYSVEELQKVVQASCAEIRALLESLGAVEVQGKVRVVGRQDIHSVTAALLETVIAQQWSIQAVVEQECMAALQASSLDVDPVVLQSALRGLCSKDGLRHTAAGTSGYLPQLPQPAATWTLDHSLLKQAAAHVVFRELRAGQQGGDQGSAVPVPVQVPLQEFIQEWTLRTPGFGVQQEVAGADLALLGGIAVRVKAACKAEGEQREEEDWLRYLPVEEVQQADAKGRLDVLFAVKDRYSAEELSPYLLDLLSAAAAPKALQELLTPHAKYDASSSLFSLK